MSEVKQTREQQDYETSSLIEMEMNKSNGQDSIFATKLSKERRVPTVFISNGAI